MLFRSVQHVRWLARSDPDAARRALDALAQERAWSPRARGVIVALTRQLDGARARAPIAHDPPRSR